MIPAAIAGAIRTSCYLEIQAFKPGNVSVYSEGHRMTAADFFNSADLIAPVMADPNLTVGERIWQATKVTFEQVGCNTNLGIILLCAPLVQAYYAPSAETIPDRLQHILRNLTCKDAEWTYRAINLMTPAGLGKSEYHDVAEAPKVTLLQAMAEAQSRDRIAYQYTHDFADIYSTGVTVLNYYLRRYQDLQNSWEWATVGCYLSFLVNFPDSHIARKFGIEVAKQVQKDAERVEKGFKACENPTASLSGLRGFDLALKSQGLNPGTSADMTVASLLALHLERGVGT